MTRLAEQLEHEAEVARVNLSADLDELRHRMTPGKIVDEVVDYARDNPVTELARNLVCDMRENPLPLLLIGAGIAWAIIATSRRPRIVVEKCPPEAKATVATWEPPPAIAERSEWEVAAVVPQPLPAILRPPGPNPLARSASGSRPWTLPGAIAATEKV